jgi:iron complex outermembrane receptor protein
MSAISSRLLLSAAVLALAATAASAQQQVAANSAGEIETVVVTGTAFDPETAPAKASLDTTEPQTIINKSYIQDSVATTGTYTTILAIAPSMTGTDLNGPGLSDNGVKNTLRGLPDGMFGLTYDGIPFGDTNGPSHHSESYFPTSTIGTINVERGPGNAGNLGPSTYGGSINMFSDVLTSDSHTLVQATAGSFGTNMINVNWQSGDVELAGLNNRLLLNYQDTNTTGYLTYNGSAAQNYTLKYQLDVAPGWTATLFGSDNNLFQQLEDNAGTTPAQAATYGKNFAMQFDNKAAGTYAGYNHVHKKTDLDYLRLQGKMAWGIAIDDTGYTYAYVNKTLSTVGILQTLTDINNGVTEGNGSVVNGVKFPNDVPGYTKQNAYRVWGNIFRASKDYDFGWLSGQLRAGVWWESSVSQRARSDYDATQCFAAQYCNPWHDQTFADSRLFTGQTGTKVTSQPFGGGFFEYEEHSGWNQYEPFVELDIKPIEDLTITPGFKYIWWNHYVNAPLEQKTKPVSPYVGAFTTTQDLPFATVNYKIQPSWSVYAQYATGIYVPDISAFEQSPPLATNISPPKAETTTNYQFGTVYYADNWTFDGDVYYIGINNNISYGPCAPPNQSETCAVNTGVATYKGIEAEGTYAFEGDLQGLAFFANGSLNNSKSGGLWLKQAPMWTSAMGLFYKRDWWKLSLIDKVVGQQYMDNTDNPFYKLGAYNLMDFKGSAAYGPMEFELGIFNLLNSRSLVSVTENDKTTAVGNNLGTAAAPSSLACPVGVATSVQQYSLRCNSTDQYSFQPSRSFQVTLKVHL